MEFYYIFILISLSCHIFQLRGSNEFIIDDEIPPNSLIGVLSTHRSFANGYVKGTSKFMILSTDKFKEYLYIQPDNGRLYSKRVIDRDNLCDQIEMCCDGNKLCNIQISIAMKSTNDLSAKSPQLVNSDPIFEQFTLIIKDINDHAPEFPMRSINISILESAPVATLIPLPIALDKDSEIYSVKLYRLLGSHNNALFNLETQFVENHSTANLRLKENLDREKTPFYRLTLLAVDGGNPARTGTVSITIIVIDVNDNSPVFELDKYRVDVNEGQPKSQSLVTVVATDRDEGENAKIIYKLDPIRSTTDSSIQFRIDSRTGDLFLINPLDYEKRRKYKLIVTASNKENVMGKAKLDGGFSSSNSGSATTTILVNVLNQNDEKPSILVDYLNVRQHAVVMENREATLFVAYLSVTDKDDGEAGQVKCQLGRKDENLFELRPANGEGKYKIFTRQRMDREHQSEYSLVVTCVDFGTPSLTNSAIITVSIADENDNKPEIKSPSIIRTVENKPQGTLIATIKANDLDIDNNKRLKFHIQSIGSRQNIGGGGRMSQSHLSDITNIIRIDEDTGVITTMTKLDREAISPPIEGLEFLLIVRDCGTPISLSVSRTMRLIIEDENDNPPQFADTSVRFTIAENEPPNQKLGEIKVTDPDLYMSQKNYIRLSLSYQRVSYQHCPFKLVVTKNDKLVANGNNNNQQYWLQTVQSLDWEQQSTHELFIIATDGSGYEAHTATATIIVTVTDINDNAPQFVFPRPIDSQSSNSSTSNVARVHILSWRQLPGFVLLTIRATDKDNPELENGKFHFAIKNSRDIRRSNSLEDGHELIGIDPDLGRVRVQRQMTKNDVGDYSVRVRVEDHGTPSLSNEMDLRFRIVDTPAQYGKGDQPDLGGNNFNRYSGHGSNSRSNSLSLFGDKESLLIFSLIIMLVVLICFIFLVAFLRHMRGWFMFLPDIFNGICGPSFHNNQDNFHHQNQTTFEQQYNKKSATLDNSNIPLRYDSSMDYPPSLHHLQQHRKLMSSPHMTMSSNILQPPNQQFNHKLGQSLVSIIPGSNEADVEDGFGGLGGCEGTLNKINRDYYEILRMENQTMSPSNYGEANMNQYPQEGYISLNHYPLPLQNNPNLHDNQKSSKTLVSAPMASPSWQQRKQLLPPVVSSQNTTTPSSTNNNNGSKLSYAVSYPAEQSTFV